MLDAIAPETNLSEEFDTPRQLFEDEDIQKSFNEASYYVRVSRMEFLMLLHAPIDAEKSKKELADTAPTEDMLRRTLRQLDFFKDKLKIYADSRPQEGYEVLYNALSAMLDAS
jgi:hypothetical protein